MTIYKRSSVIPLIFRIDFIYIDALILFIHEFKNFIMIYYYYIVFQLNFNEKRATSKITKIERKRNERIHRITKYFFNIHMHYFISNLLVLREVDLRFLQVVDII